MAFRIRLREGGGEIVRGFDMRDSSSAVLLPFGSLMGVVPTDTVQWGCKGPADIADRPSEIQRHLHSLIDPRPGNEKGKQFQWK
jgi:hypothetical protein